MINENSKETPFILSDISCKILYKLLKILINNNKDLG